MNRLEAEIAVRRALDLYSEKEIGCASLAEILYVALYGREGQVKPPIDKLVNHTALRLFDLLCRSGDLIEKVRWRLPMHPEFHEELSEMATSIDELRREMQK